MADPWLIVGFVPICDSKGRMVAVVPSYSDAQAIIAAHNSGVPFVQAAAPSDHSGGPVTFVWNHTSLDSGELTIHLGDHHMRMVLPEAASVAFRHALENLSAAIVFFPGGWQASVDQVVP